MANGFHQYWPNIIYAFSKFEIENEALNFVGIYSVYEYKSSKKNKNNDDVVQSEFPTNTNTDEYKCFVYFSNDTTDIKSTYIDDKITITENVFECTTEMTIAGLAKDSSDNRLLLKLENSRKQKIILQFETQADFDAFVASIRQKYPLPKKRTCGGLPVARLAGLSRVQHVAP